MNKRIMIITVVLLGLLALAVTAMASEEVSARSAVIQETPETTGQKATDNREGVDLTGLRILPGVLSSQIDDNARIDNSDDSRTGGENADDVLDDHNYANELSLSDDGLNGTAEDMSDSDGGDDTSDMSDSDDDMSDTSDSDDDSGDDTSDSGDDTSDSDDDTSDTSDTSDMSDSDDDTSDSDDDTSDSDDDTSDTSDSDDDHDDQDDDGDDD